MKEMRLLTHNVMRNNTVEASAGSSLRITATEVRVDESTTDDDPEGQCREIEFAKHQRLGQGHGARDPPALSLE